MRPFLTFAAQSAVALQNSLLVEDAARRKRDLEAIAEIGRILHATDRIDARALASCMAQLVVAADAEYALISSARLRQKRKGLLVGREGIVDGVGEGAARDTLRRAIETMRGRQASDAAWPSSGNDVWFAKSDPRPVLVLQFTASDPELGAIGIARTPGRAAFDSADEHLVRTVATLFGIALKRCF
jgi:hypothetical protein